MVEGARLLSEYTVKSRIVGSNPILSANLDGCDRSLGARRQAEISGVLTMPIRIDPRNPRGLVWLASYPKSGNTWVRAFLHALYRLMQGEPVAEVDINQMDNLSANERSADRYRKYLSGPADTVDPREIAAARPQVHEDLVRTAKGTVLAKTHNALISDRGFPLVNRAVSAGAVYIVRNPLDVAISFARYRNEPIDRIIADMATPRFGVTSDAERVYYVTDTWSAHVRSWTATPNSMVHIVRYEDLLAEPSGTFLALARHVLMDPTPAQLAQATSLAAFDRLQKSEAAAGFRERPPEAERFFRAGRSGEWRETLSAGQISRIVADHGEQMQRFGYLPT